MDIKAAFAPMLKKQAPKAKKHYRFDHNTQVWVEVKPVAEPVAEPVVAPIITKRLMRIDELVVGQPCKKCEGHGLLRNYGNKMCFVCSANRIIRQCDVANFLNRERRGQPTYIYETA